MLYQYFCLYQLCVTVELLQSQMKNHIGRIERHERKQGYKVSNDVDGDSKFSCLDIRISPVSGGF